MYFSKKWGKGMGTKNYVSFGSPSYSPDRRIRHHRLFVLRLCIPWFPKHSWPWVFDFRHMWIDMEPEDVMIHKGQAVGSTEESVRRAMDWYNQEG